MNTPDYDSYTLEDLLDIEAHLDNEAFPERHKHLRSILDDPVKRADLEAEHLVILEARKRAHARNKACIFSLFMWLFAVMVLLTGLGLSKADVYDIDSIFSRIGVFSIISFLTYRYLMRVLEKYKD